MSVDPGRLRVVEAVARSDVGRVRVRNEDLAFIDPLRRWAMVADGMGGYHGGEIAASLGIEFSCKALDLVYRETWSESDCASALRAAIEEANRAVHRAAGDDPLLNNMGSTLLVVCPFSGGLVSAHVGDSRLYCFRRGRLRRLTRDHTLLQEYIDEGVFSEEEVRLSGARGVLTRALGVHETVAPDVGVHEVERDDLLLLCSDGLTDMLHEQDIGEFLSGGGLDAIADALVGAANARGGRDNVTVVLLRLG